MEATGESRFDWPDRRADPVVRLQMPVVDMVTSNTPPDHCPSKKHPCLGITFRRFGKPKKHVRDVFVHEVHVQRWQCTTCGACSNQCPVGIDHVSPILELRRGQTAAGAFPQPMMTLFKGLENVEFVLELQGIGAERRQRAVLTTLRCTTRPTPA